MQRVADILLAAAVIVAAVMATALVIACMVDGIKTIIH